MATNKNYNDEELIEVIKAKYLHHLHEAKDHIKQSDRFKRMLEAYDGIDLADKPINTNDVTIADITHGVNKGVDGRTKSKGGKRTKETFESVIISIFSDGKPRLVSELIKDYQLKTGIKISSKDCSSKLSMRALKGNIKNAKFIDFPIEKRFWWGLSKWFDGDLLKPSYTAIVNEKYKNME